MTRGRDKRLPLSEISTRRAAFAEASCVFSRTLGGTTLYCLDDELIQRAIETIGEAILSAVLPHVSLDRKWVLAKTAATLGQRVDSRCFGAVLGRELRLARVASVPCLAMSGKVYRVFIHSDNIARFREMVVSVIEGLQSSTSLTVREAERICFGGREWGTWSSTSHALAHAVHNGHAVYLDKDMFAWPTEVELALR